MNREKERDKGEGRREKGRVRPRCRCRIKFLICFRTLLPAPAIPTAVPLNPTGIPVTLSRALLLRGARILRSLRREGTILLLLLSNR
jgi:hypothetical protein